MCFGGKDLCQGHFIARCYSQLDVCTDQVRKRGYWNATSVVAVMESLTKIADQAAMLGLSARDLSTMEQAQLLDILLRAANLTKGIRRVPRKRVSVPLRVRCEASGQNWTEETTTLEVSLHGTSIESRIPITSGEVLTVERLDTSGRAKGKVKWLRRNPDGSQVLGIELLDCEDFWGSG